jgi:hypothetical protein
MRVHNFVNNQLKLTRHGQHQLNENFVSHEIKHQYIMIPKNSSTWTKNKLIPAKFVKYNYIIPEYTKIIILRDPLERYISGLAQWQPSLHRRITELAPWQLVQHRLFEQDPQFLEFILKYIITIDEHTELQSWFIKEIQDDNIVFFWHDENLQSNIDHYFKSLGIELPYIHPKNVSDNSINKINAKKIIRSYIEFNMDKLDAFQEWLEVDYELCRFVEFYKSTNN